MAAERIRRPLAAALVLAAAACVSLQLPEPAEDPSLYAGWKAGGLDPEGGEVVWRQDRFAADVIHAVPASDRAG